MRKNTQINMIYYIQYKKQTPGDNRFYTIIFIELTISI